MIKNQPVDTIKSKPPKIRFYKIFVISTRISIVGMLVIFTSYHFSCVSTSKTLKKGSKLMQTTAGTIEYATIGNNKNPGSYVLILHGTPGGYDSGITLANWIAFDDNTLCVIPSRPGYLQTSIEVGMTPVDAADAMVSLLDKMGVENVTVLGWSGGGPTAIELAQRHPERVNSLILLSARCRLDGKYYFSDSSDFHEPFDPSTINTSSSFFGPNLKNYFKLLGFKIMPNFYLKSFFSDSVKNKDLTIDRLRQLSTTTGPPSHRDLGKHNDQWQFASLQRTPELHISVPTLIIHSPLDESVDFEHAIYTHENILNSELLAIDNESHFSTLNSEAIDKIKLFIKDMK